jgi:hypothetical protein
MVVTLTRADCVVLNNIKAIASVRITNACKMDRKQITPLTGQIAFEHLQVQWIGHGAAGKQKPARTGKVTAIGKKREIDHVDP